MAAAFITMLYITVFWAAVGIGAPMVTPKGPNQALIRCLFAVTGACCWLFWLICYMSQMNPLVGPTLNQRVVYMVARNWGYPLMVSIPHKAEATTAAPNTDTD